MDRLVLVSIDTVLYQWRSAGTVGIDGEDVSVIMEQVQDLSSLGFAEVRPGDIEFQMGRKVVCRCFSCF